MTEPPPANLNDWGKRALVREVERLRAVLHEHSQREGDDPRERSTQDPIIGGSPRGRGDALLDARSAVLLDGVEVVLVDTKRDEAVSMMLVLKGRVNYSSDRATHAYLFGPDGAAGIISELVELTERAYSGVGEHGRRFALEFQRELKRRRSA